MLCRMKWAFIDKKDRMTTKSSFMYSSLDTSNFPPVFGKQNESLTETISREPNGRRPLDALTTNAVDSGVVASSLVEVTVVRESRKNWMHLQRRHHCRN